MEEKINTIIFDMDGVIVDSEPINLDIIRGIYNEIGAEVPEEVHLSSLGTNSIEWWDFINKKYCNQFYKPEDLYKKERERILAYMTDPTTEKGYFEGLRSVLQELKQRGYKTAVASASHYDIINSILKNGKLENDFDLIVSGTDPMIKLGKPEPDIFLYTAEKLGVKPDQCLVIEDSENGIKAANNAQMKVAAFLSAPKLIDYSHSNYHFDHYNDFFKKINIFTQ